MSSTMSNFQLIASRLDQSSFDSFAQVAVRLGASDIHFEPMEREIRVRIRMDGELVELARMFHPANSDKPHPVIIQIKARSNMTLQARTPEDGRCEMWVDDQLMNLRVSTIPQVFGEKVVIRLFDKNKVSELSRLGFRQYNLERLKFMVNKSTGMVLLCGPTGSGKTTTLYTVLNYLNRVSRNLITVEDPVEYFLPGINQIQVDDRIGSSFEVILRSILRQDPDILMVGEIRDRSSADIAFHAALTGHLVITTVHANDTIGAIMRLVDLHVPPIMIAQALNGIIAQRLVPQLCPKCKVCKVHPPLDRMLTYEPKGCDFCYHSGVRGRMGIHEVLLMTDVLRNIMTGTFSPEEFRLLSLKEGLETLKFDAVVKAYEGSVSYRDALAISDEPLDNIVRNLEAQIAAAAAPVETSEDVF
jgi:type IV pilus assembly protein PilB